MIPPESFGRHVPIRMADFQVLLCQVPQQLFISIIYLGVFTIEHGSILFSTYFFPGHICPTLAIFLQLGKQQFASFCVLEKRALLEEAN